MGSVNNAQNGFKSDVKLMRMKPMTDKDIKDYCKNCDVEPPAMRFKCPECEHNPDKEQIMINGVDVSECKHLYSRWTGSLPKDTCAEYDYINNPEDDGLINLCKTHPNCYYKQLQKEKFENLNNRQMVESAENLIYENSELYKNLKEKEQECEQIKEKYEALELEHQEVYEIVAELKYVCKELKREVDEYKEVLRGVEGYINNQGIDNKWNMRIQKFRSDILNIISKAKGGEE